MSVNVSSDDLLKILKKKFIIIRSCIKEIERNAFLFGFYCRLPRVDELSKILLFTAELIF